MHGTMNLKNLKDMLIKALGWVFPQEHRFWGNWRYTVLIGPLR
jgi:hypothetical protein